MQKRCASRGSPQLRTPAGDEIRGVFWWMWMRRSPIAAPALTVYLVACLVWTQGFVESGKGEGGDGGVGLTYGTFGAGSLLVG